MTQFKVGDTVITERFEERGFVPVMDDLVGKKGVISSTMNGWATVHGWNWPLYALRKVDDEPEWGKEYEFSDDTLTTLPTWRRCIFIGMNPNKESIYKYIVMREDAMIGRYTYFRPIKTVNQELHDYIKDAYNCHIPVEDISKIVDIVKKYDK